MANRIKRPDPLRGTADQQTEQLRRYLMALAMELEIKLEEYERRILALEKKSKEDKGA